jgi:hypothetical protein
LLLAKTFLDRLTGGKSQDTLQSLGINEGGPKNIEGHSAAMELHDAIENGEEGTRKAMDWGGLNLSFLEDRKEELYFTDAANEADKRKNDNLGKYLSNQLSKIP